MTGNRVAYLYALFLSFLLFVLFNLYLFHLLLVFLLVLPLISLLSALPVRRALRYSMEIDDDIVPKGNCPVRLSAQNGSAFPCACVRMHLNRRNALGRIGERYLETSDEIIQFSVGARRTYTLEPPIKMAYCGRVDLSIHRVDICDMLGLFSLSVSPQNGQNSSGSIYVLPELQVRAIQTDEAADLGLDSATYSTEKAGNDPSEIFQLRDYQPGDPRHSVHWKLSSRMNRLIVREFGLPLNPSMHFLLELRAGAEPAAAERVLGTVLAFSENLMARKVTHSISWLGEEGLMQTTSVTGPDSLAIVLHELLALPGQKRWSTLEAYALQAVAQSETHLVYLIAGAVEKPAEEDTAARLLTNLIDLEVCRRLTLMPERCSRETAKGLMSLGCEVQLLDGRILGAEAEEEL